MRVFMNPSTVIKKTQRPQKAITAQLKYITARQPTDLNLKCSLFCFSSNINEVGITVMEYTAKTITSIPKNPMVTAAPAKRGVSADISLKKYLPSATTKIGKSKPIN